MIGRETLVAFIEKYKSHTALWDVTNSLYYDRKKRASALEELAPLLGKHATVDTVRRKIDILRNGYLRELKKIKAYKANGSTYKPILWYFNHMSFLQKRKRDFKQEQDIAAQINEDTYESKYKSTQEKDVQATDTNFMLLDFDKNRFYLYLSDELEKVSLIQKAIAENLMAKILYHARMDQLKYSTDIALVTSRTIHTNTLSPSTVFYTNAYPNVQNSIYTPTTQYTNMSSPPSTSHRKPIQLLSQTRFPATQIQNSNLTSLSTSVSDKEIYVSTCTSKKENSGGIMNQILTFPPKRSDNLAEAQSLPVKLSWSLKKTQSLNVTESENKTPSSSIRQLVFKPSSENAHPNTVVGNKLLSVKKNSGTRQYVRV